VLEYRAQKFGSYSRASVKPRRFSLF
jgi:hypothetical protein